METIEKLESATVWQAYPRREGQVWVLRFQDGTPVRLPDGKPREFRTEEIALSFWKREQRRNQRNAEVMKPSKREVKPQNSIAYGKPSEFPWRRRPVTAVTGGKTLFTGGPKKK